MHMQFLELKIPPAVLALLYAAMMLGLVRIGDWASLSIPASEWVAVMLALLGFAIIFKAAYSFFLVKTTVNPLKPELTITLIREGVYAISRNPMYVGFALLLLAWGVFLQNMLAILWVPTFMIYMNRFQILPEERVLEAKFGQPYRQYCVSVHRWL